MAHPRSAPLGPEDLGALRHRVRGTVLGPDDGEYDRARRIWNGMVDKHPAAIVRCRDSADVAAVVSFARETGVPVSVRGGGHNVAGNALCDGVVIDLSLMNGVRVDPDARRVHVQGGALLGDVDRETQRFGLAVPMGIMSRTGVAGLALHGGIGLLMRRFGLTSDNLRSAEVVTADGVVRTTSAGEHPDLFWALRGGGGNFGAVTSFEFQAYLVGPEVWVAMVAYPLASATRVMRAYRDIMARAPDELVGFCSFWSTGHEEPVPEPHRGVPVIIAAACYSGPVDQGETRIAALRTIEAPLFDLSGPMPFLAAQQLFDAEYPDGRRYYWKSIYLSRLDDSVARTLEQHALRRPSPLTSIDVIELGGAVSRVPPDETAFAQRSAPYLVAIEANWDDPAADRANVSWAREVFDDLRRFSPGGSYLNFPGFGEEGEAQVRDAYAGNYARLEAIKRQYDPDNLFRSNLNIRVLT